MPTSRTYRFEVRAAYVLGVVLPVFEMARRRTNFDDIPAYIDDFIIGGFLLLAARAVSRGKAHGPALLAAAWGALCGGMWGAFFGQIANPRPTDVSGLSNWIVIVLKAAVYLVAIAAMVMAVRRAAEGYRGKGEG